MSNSIEQEAIDIVIAYEKSQGRDPKDVSKSRCGFDIRSGDRCIEVKGQSKKRASRIWISNTIVRSLGKNLLNYYIYMVYDIKNKPKLKILDANSIFKNLKIDTSFLLTTSAINEHGEEVDI